STPGSAKGRPPPGGGNNNDRDSSRAPAGTRPWCLTPPAPTSTSTTTSCWTPTSTTYYPTRAEYKSLVICLVCCLKDVYPSNLSIIDDCALRGLECPLGDDEGKEALIREIQRTDRNGERNGEPAGSVVGSPF